MSTNSYANNGPIYLPYATWLAMYTAGTDIEGQEYRFTDIQNAQLMTGASAPTTSTACIEIGALYLETTNKVLYMCTAHSGSTYTWNPVAPTPTPDAEVERKAASLTAWNQYVNAGSVTPAVTLPAPDTTKSQTITYIFTAATTGATFTAPSGWIVCGSDGTAGLSAGNTLTCSDLTVGSIYECSFRPVSGSIIRLVMLETKTA